MNTNKETPVVNRLVLIGNGFDLAHGLETSYTHFIRDYCNTILDIICKNIPNNSIKYDDTLINILVPSQVSIKEIIYKHESNDYDPIETFVEFMKLKTREPLYHEHFDKYTVSNFTLDICPILYSSLKQINNLKWVDIEKLFFKELSGNNKISEVNKAINFMKDKLIAYLDKQHLDDSIFIDKVYNQLSRVISNQDTTINLGNDYLDYNNLLILNFNYTNTFKRYLPLLRLNNRNHIHIHGKLNATSEKDKPLFGYADELDETYKSFENFDDNNRFENIKTFKYLLSDNYNYFLNFIESNYFQVYIYGHSCGVSDRTLLNQIFEHPNCISIKPFFYQWEDENGELQDDYLEKSYAIYRNFTDKTELRKRVVNKTYCEPMPSIND